MEKKVCTQCGLEKELFKFEKRSASKDGHNASCKSCRSNYHTQRREQRKKYNEDYYKNNGEHLQEYHSSYYKNNKEDLQKYATDYYHKNQECRRQYSRDYYHKNQEHRQQYSRDYYKKNREARLQYSKDYSKNNRKAINEYIKNKSDKDINFKLNRRIRATINTEINRNRNKNTKSYKTLELLGCSISEARSYLESKFLEGMSWDNHGLKGWHIDHIKPLASFDLTDPEQQKQAFHYTNLQPLWWRENLQKGSKWQNTTSE
jgi:hypothetical protein